MKIFKTVRPWYMAGLLVLLWLPGRAQSGDWNYSLNLLSVSFSGTQYQEIMKDDGSATYSAPHWTDGGVKKPVSYRSGSQPKVSATFFTGLCLKNPDFDEVLVKGVGNGFEFPPKPVSLQSVNSVYEATYANQSFTANKVDFWDDNFIINWYASIDQGDTWYEVGASEHMVYVTHKSRYTPPSGSQIPFTFFHTLVHLGCKNAAGKFTPQAIVDAMYSEFQDQKVYRVDGAGPMTYWGTTNPAPEPSCWETAGLLEFLDGRCGAWQSFFDDMIKAQGIDASSLAEVKWRSNYTLNTDDVNSYVDDRNLFFGLEASAVGIFGSAEFYVKKWNLNSNEKFVFSETDVTGSYPVTTNATGNSIYWRETEGIAGQGNNDPRSIFCNHAIVKYGDNYYDPSYGTPMSASKNDWETGAISGFGTRAVYTKAFPGGFEIDYLILWVGELNNPNLQVDISP